MPQGSRPAPAFPRSPSRPGGTFRWLGLALLLAAATLAATGWAAWLLAQSWPDAAAPPPAVHRITVHPNLPELFTSDDGQVTLAVDQGAVSAPVAFHLEELPPDALPPFPSGAGRAVKAYDIFAAAAWPGYFHKPITLIMRFDATDFPAAAPASPALSVLHYHSAERGWERLPAEVDLPARQIWAQTQTLSLFALTVASPGGDTGHAAASSGASALPETAAGPLRPSPAPAADSVTPPPRRPPAGLGPRGRTGGGDARPAPGAYGCANRAANAHCGRVGAHPGGGRSGRRISAVNQ